MKSQTIFNFAFIIVFTSFLACNEAPIETEAKDKVKQKIEMLCSEDRHGTLTHEIDGVCAESSILAYDEYIEQVKLSLGAGNGAKLIRGSKINREDFYQVIDLLDSDSAAVPYIMLAFKEDALGVYTDLIFTIQTGNGASNEDYKYFDFTQPCPTACPNLYRRR